MRSALITAGIVLLVVFLYAQLVRRTSIFFPSKYPAGNWNVAGAEDVTFMSGRVRLHGWFFRAGHPVIVWYHGNAGNITERAPMATELARRGISVLLFDWRGYGKSEGSPSESALYTDALAAYDFARAHAGGEIVPYGESLGGPYAAYVAVHRKVPCVVIENSIPSMAAMANAMYAPFPMGIFVPFGMSTARWLNQAGVPVLVMHGKRDQVIPYALGQKLYDELHVPKEMLTSETAGHCEIPTAEPQRYYDTVVRFVAR